MKDVKNIHDIPNIEDYIDKKFKFECYDVDGKTTSYRFREDSHKVVRIDVISEESFILKKIKLLDILFFDDISFFSFSLRLNDSERIQHFAYRPLVDEVDKVY